MLIIEGPTAGCHYMRCGGKTDAFVLEVFDLGITYIYRSGR